jgi:hypothetical protein
MLKHFTGFQSLHCSPDLRFFIELFNHKQPKQLMREINNTARVSVRKYAEACVSRIMRETW